MKFLRSAAVVRDLSIAAMDQGLRRGARGVQVDVHAAYGGIVLSVIGLLGSVPGIPKVIAYVGGEEVARPAASIAQSIMALILIVLIASLLKFVVAERRQARSR